MSIFVSHRRRELQGGSISHSFIVCNRFWRFGNAPPYRPKIEMCNIEGLKLQGRAGVCPLPTTRSTTPLKGRKASARYAGIPFWSTLFVHSINGNQRKCTIFNIPCRSHISYPSSGFSTSFLQQTQHAEWRTERGMHVRCKQVST